MKIRMGFVSNSSSTSFCIYGKYVDTKDYTGELGNAIKKLGLFFHCDQEGDGYYIGRSFTDIKDNETGKEFRDSTLKLMQEVFPDIKELSVIEEGWYDG